MTSIQEKTNLAPDEFPVSFWFPLYPQDILIELARLSNEEIGVYLKFLCHHWNNKNALKDDNKTLARLAGISIQKWKKIRPNLIEYFTIHDGIWIHKPLEAQREWASLNRMKKQVAAYIKHGNREKAEEIADKYNAILAARADAPAHAHAGKTPMHLHCPITVTRTLTSLTSFTPSGKEGAA